MHSSVADCVCISGFWWLCPKPPLGWGLPVVPAGGLDFVPQKPRAHPTLKPRLRHWSQKPAVSQRHEPTQKAHLTSQLWTKRTHISTSKTQRFADALEIQKNRLDSEATCTKVSVIKMTHLQKIWKINERIKHEALAQLNSHWYHL